MEVSSETVTVLAKVAVAALPVVEPDDPLTLPVNFLQK